jgi:hypothetical protein
MNLIYCNANDAYHRTYSIRHKDVSNAAYDATYSIAQRALYREHQQLPV